MDIKTRKIKNYITYTMVLTGLLAGFLIGGINGLLNSILATIVAATVLIILPGSKASGGDIKLIAGCGAWIGTVTDAVMLVFISLAIVTPAFLVLYLRKNGLKHTLSNIKIELLTLFRSRIEGERLPIAPFVLLGYILLLIIKML